MQPASSIIPLEPLACSAFCLNHKVAYWIQYRPFYEIIYIFGLEIERNEGNVTLNQALYKMGCIWGQGLVSS